MDSQIREPYCGVRERSCCSTPDTTAEFEIRDTGLFRINLPSLRGFPPIFNRVQMVHRGLFSAEVYE